MTDPMEALNNLQAALNAKAVKLSPCDLHHEIQVLFDYSNDPRLIAYVQVKKSKVQAIALIVYAKKMHGLPCYQAQYAVAESMRGQGIGARILQQAIDELVHGLSRTTEFFLEVIVSIENVASNNIAKRLISDSPKPCKDALTGESANQYLCKLSYSRKNSLHYSDASNMKKSRMDLSYFTFS